MLSRSPREELVRQEIPMSCCNSPPSTPVQAFAFLASLSKAQSLRELLERRD